MEEAPRPADPQMSLLKQLLSEWMERETSSCRILPTTFLPSHILFTDRVALLIEIWSTPVSAFLFFVSQGTRDRNPSLTSELNRIVSCWLLASSVKDARQEGKWNGTRDIADLFTFCEPHNFIRPQILRKRKLKKKQPTWVETNGCLALGFFF